MRFINHFLDLYRLQFIMSLALLLSANQCFADAFIAGVNSSQISALKQGDINFINKQHRLIDDLARRHLGSRLRLDKQNDLETMQKLLDQKLVRPDQTLELQAMGVVLGELYIKDLGVRWVIYHDNQGRSRALQWSASKELLFPVTMISRRVEVGIRVDLFDIYTKGARILQKQQQTYGNKI